MLAAFHFRPIEPAAATSFFRRNHYKAAAKSGDAVYGLVEHEELVAAVRLAPRVCKELGELRFLRSLCVDRVRRRRGLATRLLRDATSTDEALPFFCFACAELDRLYRKAGFIEADEHALPGWLGDRFASVAAQQQRKARCLRLMTLRFPLSIVLLQHANEPQRPTGTGTLLMHPSLAGRHLHVQVLRWSGRADNQALQQQLERFRLCDLIRLTFLFPAACGTAT